MKMEKVNSLGWELKLVSELIEDFERGISYSSEDIVSPDGIPLMNLACVDKTGFYRPNRLKFYSGEYSDSQKIFPNDMLVACTDMTREAEIIGTPILVPEEADFLLYTMDLALLKPNEGVCPMFLYYALKTKYYRKYIKPWASGTNVLHLNLKGIYDYKLYIPKELAEQEKIGKVLANIDRKIELNKAINANLEATAKQLYDYWFVQFDFPDSNGRPYKSSGGKMLYNPKLKRPIPAGWESAQIKNLIEPIERGISYSSEDIQNPNATPMINLACFSKEGNYRTGEMKYYSGEVQDEKLVKPMDMLVACTDMTQGADIIGRPIFVSSEYDSYTFSTDLALIRPINATDKMFLFHTLRTSFYHKYIKPFASGTNVKHLNIKGMENYLIPLPPCDLRNRFDLLANPIFKQINLRINEMRDLTALRDTLLPMLMNGQVSVL